MLVSGGASADPLRGPIAIDERAVARGRITPGDEPGFPATLSQPGSYRLAGNLLIGDLDGTAIEITSDEVTLDLGGFEILGPCRSLEPGPCLGEAQAVDASSRRRVVVRGGTVSHFPGGAIVAGDEARVDELRLYRNEDAVRLGAHALVRNCELTQNRGSSVVVSSGIVEGNVLVSNNPKTPDVPAGSFRDILCDSPCVIRSNTSRGISGSGVISGNNVIVDEIHMPGGGLVLGNTVSESLSTGIRGSAGRTGYRENLVHGSKGAAVIDAVDLGGNVCDGASCP